jgi:hypothetical protein
MDIRPFTDNAGIGRCHLVLEPVVVQVDPRPCRPFQGWRYLEHKDAPAISERERRASVRCPKACAGSSLTSACSNRDRIAAAY